MRTINTYGSKQCEKKHLNYLQLIRFDKCPLSFKLHCIYKKRTNPLIIWRFGIIIHFVIDTIIREHIEKERIGLLSTEKALNLYRISWSQERIKEILLYQEGVDILRRFVHDQGILDHRNILAIDQEFRLSIASFNVLGFIDRVDAVDDETVEIIDYQTNYLLWDIDDIDYDLRISIYHLAAMQLWPWANNVEMNFHISRHGVYMKIRRSKKQRQTSLNYVQNVCRQIEEATHYPPRLHNSCIYCDYKQHCVAYADALWKKRESICEDLNDLEAVAKERERVACPAKAFYDRKRNLDQILHSQLQDNDMILSDTIYADNELHERIESIHIESLKRASEES